MDLFVEDAQEPAAKKNRRSVAMMETVLCVSCGDKMPISISVRRYKAKVEKGLKFLCKTCIDVCGVCGKVCPIPHCPAYLGAHAAVSAGALRLSTAGVSFVCPLCRRLVLLSQTPLDVSFFCFVFCFTERHDVHGCV